MEFHDARAGPVFSAQRLFFSLDGTAPTSNPHMCDMDGSQQDVPPPMLLKMRNQ